MYLVLFQNNTKVLDMCCSKSYFLDFLQRNSNTKQNNNRNCLIAMHAEVLEISIFCKEEQIIKGGYAHKIELRINKRIAYLIERQKHRIYLRFADTKFYKKITKLFIEFFPVNVYLQENRLC